MRVNDAHTIEGINLKIGYVAGDTIDFWKLGGLLSIGASPIDLKIAAAMTTFGAEVSPIIPALGAFLAGLGFTPSNVVVVLLEDEKGGGWVFYKDFTGIHVHMKI